MLWILINFVGRKFLSPFWFPRCGFFKRYLLVTFLFVFNLILKQRSRRRTDSIVFHIDESVK